MPARLAASVLADIESALSEPGPLPFGYLQQIAEINSTSIQTVCRIKKRLDYGFKAIPLSGGPVPILQDEHEKALKLVLDKRPWMSLDNLQVFFLEAYTIKASLSTICRALKRIKV